MQFIEQLRAKMRQKDEWFQVGGARDSNATDVERMLGRPLPEHYRQFLNQYGYLEWFGDSIYGLAGEDMDPEDAREICISARTKYYKSLHPQLELTAAIAQDQRGGFYYFKPGEDDIYHYESETDEEELFSPSINDLVGYLSQGA